MPYIIAIAIIRAMSEKIKRSRILYLGMGMMIIAFIGFMVAGRNVGSYLFINTLMLGACGIFDLFWWSILGEMLDYTKKPSLVFGIGLTANVLGVLFGGAIGIVMKSINLPNSEITVIALTVVCATLAILPSLNRQLVLLLKNHACLYSFGNLNQVRKDYIIENIESVHPLTNREKEVLQLILMGKSNREIAEQLFISENTVKTHTKNIFSKYDVTSRAELISIILKCQNEEQII